MLALAAGLAAPPAAAAQGPQQAGGPEPRVSIVILPRGTTASGIAARSPEISVGLLSAGLGAVPADQTYLDIGQGNRLFDSLYPSPLPPLRVRAFGVREAAWERELERADDAPAAIEPGLLVGELRRAGVPAAALPGIRDAALLAVGPDGSIDRALGCSLGECPGLTVGRADRSELAEIVAGLRRDDLLIALEQPPPLGRLLSVGLAGRGFDGGNLDSETTRIPGYVLSTDLAPTILERFGLPVPDAVSGRALGSTGERDVGGIAALAERMSVVSDRRHAVLGVNVIVWVALTALAALLFGARGARPAVTALAVTIAWVPALLLLTAAIEPSELGERLAVGLGGPALALVSIRALRTPFDERAGFAAFALAAAITVAATAIDIVAGSPLTALSVIGPNPELGVRFFGIGNELEAVIGTLIALGSGAAVAALRPADPRRAVAIAAAAAALAGVLVFAPGRLGADVGAAITFPAGAAGVVIAALGAGRRRLLAVAAVPVLAVAVLVAIDLAIGGDAHLSRSVLDAGGLDELGQVVERRVRLGARSFERFVDSFFYAAALALIAGAIAYRRPILGWFADRPAARAGFIGGIAAAVVGSLANDSGALLLLIGTAYLAGFAGLALAAQHGGSPAPAPAAPGAAGQCFRSDSESG